ncbi:glycosyltransferase family 2 protein [Chryseobacterium sp. FH1]|uniref:glycosyltransferase family 2 protein n=1 Tax=Chryseobacterium sp. FH1 TaxID=1233951 RepID=UPI0004E332C7|nr:glycosyltransferase family 2 protein [Chryseobacterium sp. FH1]KFC24579.1 hypothetical protein IO90_00225 [Chryseobacterium sp. FH1]
MPILTVFTPAYNRADLLERLYNSLLSQTNANFKWLIIDDGSSDNTQSVVENWKAENKIPIECYFKENGGIHTAYNLGIEKADTELFICIDSDDFMPEDGVENITKFWERNGSEDVAGIIGLDYDLDGKPLKNRMLPEVDKLYITELATKYKFDADVKMVHKTKLLKEVAPMKVFPGEKNFNPIYLFLKVDEKLPMLVLNKNFCFVDYQETGMANNILNQFMNSPRSFAELRKLNMSMSRVTPAFIFKNAVHYVSSSIIAKKRDWFSDSPKKAYTLLAIPFGIALTIYLKIKTRN